MIYFLIRKLKINSLLPFVIIALVAAGTRNYYFFCQ